MSSLWPSAGVPLVAVVLVAVWCSSSRQVARARSSYPGAFLAIEREVQARRANATPTWNFEAWADGFVRQKPLDRLPFTPTLTCEPLLSLLMDRFDWQLVPASGWSRKRGCGKVDSLPWSNRTRTGDPKTVWAAPHALPRLLAAAARSFDPRRADRVVVFSGTEMPLSRAFGKSEAERNATVRQLRKYFARIVYQAKDIDLPHVHLAPHGLCWGCMYAVLGELLGIWMSNSTRGQRAFAELLGGFSAGLSGKTRGVLASKSGKPGWLEDPGTLRHVRALEAAGGLFPPSNSSPRSVAAAWESRRRLQGWLGTPAARELAVEHRQLGPVEWWRELSTYRFLLAPMGSGIQTAKPIDALLVLTVPIVQRMAFPTYDELMRMGFPIVVVTAWAEVTRSSTIEWWRRLAPRLEAFRRNCLTIDGYWRMYTGLASHCA